MNKKNSIYTFLLLPALAMVLLSSCVAKKKYLAAQDRIAALQTDSLSLNNQISQLKKQIQMLEGKVSKMEAENQFTNNQLDNKSKELSMSKEELEQQRKKLQQLQALIDQQQRKTEQLRKKIADALVNFNSDQLTVSMKNGKVYVSMQESLLFPSGSAVINGKGKEAVGTLSAVLNQNPDINVEVEGHTDSIPITKRYQDNWELSTARSTAIARIMIDEYSVSPSRITASGRSQYQPIASNATPEGRQENRRTEIILEPKLDELMKLIEGD